MATHRARDNLPTSHNRRVLFIGNRLVPEIFSDGVNVGASMFPSNCHDGPLLAPTAKKWVFWHAGQKNKNALPSAPVITVRGCSSSNRMFQKPRRQWAVCAARGEEVPFRPAAFCPPPGASERGGRGKATGHGNEDCYALRYFAAIALRADSRSRECCTTAARPPQAHRRLVAPSERSLR